MWGGGRPRTSQFVAGPRFPYARFRIRCCGPTRSVQPVSSSSGGVGCSGGVGSSGCCPAAGLGSSGPSGARWSRDRRLVGDRGRRGRLRRRRGGRGRLGGLLADDAARRSRRRAGCAAARWPPRAGCSAPVVPASRRIGVRRSSSASACSWPSASPSPASASGRLVLGGRLAGRARRSRSARRRCWRPRPRRRPPRPASSIAGRLTWGSGAGTGVAVLADRAGGVVVRRRGRRRRRGESARVRDGSSARDLVALEVGDGAGGDGDAAEQQDLHAAGAWTVSSYGHEVRQPGRYREVCGRSPRPRVAGASANVAW